MELQVHAMALHHIMCPGCPHLLLRFLPSIGTGVTVTEWLGFRMELDSIFNTPTYASLTAKDQIASIVHWMGPEMQNLYYSSSESECDAMELDIQHFRDPVTEVWRPVRATMLEWVKFTNMN